MAERHALVVDDDYNLNQLFSKKLKRAGYQIDSRYSVNETIAYLEAGNQPRLMVLDLDLPDGEGTDVLTYMAGVGLLDAVHVIVVSAHAFARENRTLNQYTPYILMKPVSPRQLLVMADYLVQQPVAVGC